MQYSPRVTRQKPNTSPGVQSGASSTDMAPPPMQIDPALESMKAISLAIPPMFSSLDQFLSPTSGPQQKPAYPRQLSDLNLSPQDRQVLQMEPNDFEPRPMPKYYPYPDPWVGLAQPTTNQGHLGIHVPINPHGLPSNRCWRSSGSDIESSTTGRQHLDSGYWTQSPTTRSVFSGEPLVSNQDCQSLTRGVNELDFSPEKPATESCPMVLRDCHYESAKPRPNCLVEQPLICHDCDITSKNPSEHKYVSC